MDERMTAETDLLPLPLGLRHPMALADHVQTYARANVAHATAAKDAEIEALRAEVLQIERENREGWKQATHWRGRAERLAGALRDARECGNDGDWQSARRIIDAALDQETTNG